MYTSVPNQNQYGVQYGSQLAGAVKGSTLQYRVEQHRTRGRFLGLTYASLIFMFVLMAAATILSMYSRTFRHFIHHKITMIVVGVLMGFLTLFFIFCDTVIKNFQIIFFLIYSIGLALLAGILVTHLKSMIVVYAIFLIVVLVLGLAAFACTFLIT